MIKFGPSGTGSIFEEEGFSKTIDVPNWLKGKGLDLYEYSFGRGVRMSEETAKIYGAEFAKHGIEISVHAPYFINLATQEEDKAANNHRYIKESLIALKNLGGQRCVFHPGSPLKMPREQAMDLLMSRLDNLLCDLYDSGLAENTMLAIETMGKQAQLGDVDEIIRMVARDKMLYPCIDFGHLNARTGGSLKSYDDYMRVLEKFIKGVGFDKVDNMHVHFSKIEYTAKGEVRHLTFEDTNFGPDFEPLAKALIDLNLHPFIVCESAGTQTIDSLYMKNCYNNMLK